MLPRESSLANTHERYLVPNDFYQSSIEALLKSYRSGDFNEQDWVILRRCDSQENCETYIDRFRGTEQERLSPLIYKINLRHRSKVFSALDPFDAECLICVLEYEDTRSELENRKYRAIRVRQSGEKRGWKQAIENIVVKRGVTDGFAVLNKGKRLDVSFEAFVINNRERFPSNVLDAAKARLSANGYASGT